MYATMTCISCSVGFLIPCQPPFIRACIRSVTLDRLLPALARQPVGDVPPVVVVDEAAMVGTRKLASLLDHASRLDAKVVLVGDPHHGGDLDLAHPLVVK